MPMLTMTMMESPTHRTTFRWMQAKALIPIRMVLATMLIRTMTVMA